MTFPGAGTELGYDPGAMLTGLAAIDTATQEVRTMLNSIQSEVDALTASWRAQSNVAFTAAHTAWATRAGELNKTLKVMRDKLSATDSSYARTEQARVDQYAAPAGRI